MDRKPKFATDLEWFREKMFYSGRIGVIVDYVLPKHYDFKNPKDDGEQVEYFVMFVLNQNPGLNRTKTFKENELELVPNA